MTRPRLAHLQHDEYLRDAAIHLLRQREDGYPRLVTAGKLTAAAAAHRLELSRCLVAQWRWATDPAGPPLPPLLIADAPAPRGYFGAWARELADELVEIAAGARARADHTPADGDAAELADLCAALLWYQRGAGSETCRLTDQVAFARAVTAEHRARQLPRAA